MHSRLCKIPYVKGQKKTNVKAWATLGEPQWIQPKWECGRDMPTAGDTHFLFYPETADYIFLPLLSLGEARWLSSSQWNVNRSCAPPPSHNPPASAAWCKRTEWPYQPWIEDNRAPRQWTWVTESQEKPPTGRNTYVVTDINLPYVVTDINLP